MNTILVTFILEYKIQEGEKAQRRIEMLRQPLMVYVNIVKNHKELKEAAGSTFSRLKIN